MGNIDTTFNNYCALGAFHPITLLPQKIVCVSSFQCWLTSVPTYRIDILNEVYCSVMPYIFCQLNSKCPYDKKNIIRQLKDMDFMFSWQEQYLTRSLHSLMRYCSCHENIKSISSRNRVISSISKSFKQ